MNGPSVNDTGGLASPEASKLVATSAPLMHQENRNARLVPDIFLPDETRVVREEARAFADEVLRPAAHGLNCTPECRNGFRHDIFQAIARASLYEIPFGKDVGGRGLQFPMLATLTVIEELGYYSPGVASAMYDAQAILVGGTLDAAGGMLRETFLPKLVRGEFVGAFATSEPDASTDLSVRSIRTSATSIGGGWRVDGTKRWITNSPAADHLVLLCRTGEGLSMFFVDMDAPRITISDPDLKMGNHAQLTADVRFDNVFVPEAHLLGALNGGLRTALSALALGRMGIGALGVGMSQRAIDVASAYMKRRAVFGRPVASFQHWQFRFAELATELESARMMYQKAALAADRGDDASVLAAMAKIKGSALAVDVAREAIQACGGYGFVRDLGGPHEEWPLEAIYRDAKIGEIYEGANEVQKWIIARRLFGREITG